MGDVLEKSFWIFFVRGFRSDSGGRFSMVFGGFGEGGSVSQALGRSVGRSGARSVGRSPLHPLPLPSPRHKKKY